MKLQRVEAEPHTELERLGEEVRRLRQPGRNLILPGDLRVRICRLHQAGVTLAKIRRVTGVQSAAIKAWMKKCKSAEIPRPFKVVTVEERRVEVQNSETLIFRFASGKVTVEVALSALSPELLRVLTSC